MTASRRNTLGSLTRATLAACAACAGAAMGLIAGCGSAVRDEPRTAALPLSNEKVSIGQQVFAQHCYQCHPGGAGGVAPAINDKPLPVWLMKTQVRAGLGSMPSFSKDKIDDQQLDALMVYLKALRATAK